MFGEIQMVKPCLFLRQSAYHSLIGTPLPFHSWSQLASLSPLPWLPNPAYCEEPAPLSLTWFRWHDRHFLDFCKSTLALYPFHPSSRHQSLAPFGNLWFAITSELTFWRLQGGAKLQIQSRIYSQVAKRCQNSAPIPELLVWVRLSRGSEVNPGSAKRGCEWDEVTDKQRCGRPRKETMFVLMFS